MDVNILPHSRTSRRGREDSLFLTLFTDFFKKSMNIFLKNLYLFSRSMSLVFPRFLKKSDSLSIISTNRSQKQNPKNNPSDPPTAAMMSLLS